MSGVDRLFGRDGGTKARFAVTDLGFAFLSAAAELVSIVAIAGAVGMLYHFFVYHDLDQLKYCVAGGAVVALLYVLTFAFRGAYNINAMIDEQPYTKTVTLIWNYAMFGLLITGLLTKSTDIYSRGWIIVFYLVGLPAMHLARVFVKRAASHGLASGLIAPRSVLLVGTADRIGRFRQRVATSELGLRIVTAALLPDVPANCSGGEAAGNDKKLAWQVRGILEQAENQARALGVDNVYILAPMSDGITIDCCLDVFAALPVSIHIVPDELSDRFANVRIERNGDLLAFGLTEPPLSPLDQLTKRCFDIAASLAGLILLMPFLLLAWAVVKLDSPGPGLFLQRRHGYNQRAFKILKFRSMSCLDDGADVPQAKVDDPRITRVGYWLRRWNIDELPQLVNVLKGDMSIVGPRPHAIAHDVEYEQKIQRYTRRLNVKPGITGWAQVNGLRGETDTDDKMRRRLAYDLYYIDNWSLRLDLTIIALTFFSPKAFRNAR